MSEIQINGDNYQYIRYVGPQILEREIMTLSGMLSGIVADQNIDYKEMRAIQKWLDENNGHRNKHPFNELFFEIENIVKSEAWEAEGLENIQWLCQKILSKENAFYSLVTREMQILHGILAGILSDGVITKEELQSLRDWIYDKDILKGCWPYDEVETLITQVLKDKTIDQQEQSMLIEFFSEFVYDDPLHKSISLKEIKGNSTISGLCAVAPEVKINGNTFCFTGKFKKCSRSQLAERVARLGGMFVNHLSKQVDYLIVGSDGNAAWAFSCYGRKVEEAVNLRKQGSTIMIIHENDYWDAVRDYMATLGMEDDV